MSRTEPEQHRRNETVMLLWEISSRSRWYNSLSSGKESRVCAERRRCIREHRL